jgi:carboxypeptidase PM20D1
MMQAGIGGKSKMKRILGWVAALLLVVLLVLLARTLMLRPIAPLAAPLPPIAVDEAALAQGLSDALRIPTISHSTDIEPDAAAFEQFIALLAQRFPRVHAAMSPQRVAGFSLLYTWPGRDPQALPGLLAAHMDVVPVEAGRESAWTHPPFDGVIADGYVWGRGALDDKASLMSLLEAAEWLLAQGFQPAHTLYFAFGHDEEIGGERGASAIAALLQSRGVRLAYTLDEGSAVTHGIVTGVERPVASIMAGEKGYVTFRLTARATGGHSSMPTPDGAIVQLSRALTRIEDQPMPMRLTPPVAAMLDRLAPEMPFTQRFAIANRELFEPLLLQALARGPITQAIVRSTQAITVFHAGIKDNILPTEAYALINLRLLPGDRIADVQAHLRKAIADERIEITQEAGFGNEAPPLSDPGAPAFQALARAANEVFPDAIVASGIILATTDNRHYAGLREQAYYFAPFPYTAEDGARVHGTNERIGVQDYANMVRYYVQLMRHSGT